MYLPATVLMLFVCHNFGEHIAGVVLATILLSVSGGLLWASRTGKLKVMRVSGYLARGKEAKLAAAIFAAWFLFVGTLTLIATIFHLEC